MTRRVDSADRQTDRHMSGTATAAQTQPPRSAYQPLLALEQQQQQQQQQQPPSPVAASHVHVPATARTGDPHAHEVVSDTRMYPHEVAEKLRRGPTFVSWLNGVSSFASLFLLSVAFIFFLEAVAVNFANQLALLLVLGIGALLFLIVWLALVIVHHNAARRPDKSRGNRPGRAYSWRYQWAMWSHWAMALVVASIMVASTWSWVMRHNISGRYPVEDTPVTPISWQWDSVCTINAAVAPLLLYAWLFALVNHYWATEELAVRHRKSTADSGGVTPGGTT